MEHSAKYPATVLGVKRGLKALKRSQRQGARATGRSVALVSLVLSKKVTSQPCLDDLAAWLNDGAPLAVKAS